MAHDYDDYSYDSMTMTMTHDYDYDYIYYELRLYSVAQMWLAVPPLQLQYEQYVESYQKNLWHRYRMVWCGKVVDVAEWTPTPLVRALDAKPAT